MKRFAWTLWCVLLWWCAALWLARGTAAEDVHTKGIDHLLDILNFRRLHSRIKEGRWKVYGVEMDDNATPCIENVSLFLEALRRGAAWADMLYDASGRYSSQFFFGNDYWLGSTKLCQELDKAVQERTLTEESRFGRTPEKREAEDAESMVRPPSSVTSAENGSATDPFDRRVAKHENGSRSAQLSESEGDERSTQPKENRTVPPFRVGFHVVSVAVELPADISPKPRLIRIGVCMPRSCSATEISSLISLSAADRDGLTQAVPKGTTIHRGRSVNVVRVRPVPGNYNWKKDPKTYIIGGATIIVLILMVLAEVCELYLRHCRRGLEEECVLSKMKMKDEEVGRNNNDGESMDLRKYHVTKIDPSPGLLLRLLLCFSIRQNGKKILFGAEDNGKDGEKNLACIHGLRVISMGWVILVHTYLVVFAIAENKKLRSVTERNLMFQTVSNATFSVDTFFLISGILVAYLYFRTKSKDKLKEGAHNFGVSMESNPSNSKTTIAACSKESGAAFVTNFLVFIKLLGYRFLRLTPPYLWVIGIADVGMNYTINYSVFEPRLVGGDSCAKYWWRNVLYINSLFPHKEMCMIWSWYMANDTQFYAIGILLLLLSARYFRFATVAGIIFVISSWITTAVISIHYEYHVSIQDPFALFDELYDKPWLRLGPYMVGMVTGWFLHRTALNIRMPKVAVLSGWFLSLSCMAILVYGVALLGDHLGMNGSVGLGLTSSAVYTSLGHTAWAIAVAWIVVACSTGHGGWISGILCWSSLRPFSRLTYCAFLIHPLVMMLTSFRMQSTLHLENSVVVMIYLGYMLASFVAAFFISVCFEAPAVSLLKMAFQMPKSKINTKSPITDSCANENDCKLFPK